MKKKVLLDPKGNPIENKIKDDKVNLEQGKVIDFNQNEPNVFVEVTTPNRELMDKLGEEKLGQSFVPIVQLLTQYSDIFGEGELLIAFKNKSKDTDKHRTMAVRYVHGDKVADLLNDDFTDQFKQGEKKEERVIPNVPKSERADLNGTPSDESK